MGGVSTRQAEIGVAAGIAILCLYFMVKASELPIGWVPQQGPGGGAFPFWLSAVAFVAAIAVLVRAWRGLTPPSRSDAPFVAVGVGPLLGAIVGSLLALLVCIHILGFYVAVPAFLIFHLRILGGLSWRATGLTAVLTPVVLFFLFEVLLKTMLPKGITEPLFYPLYAIFL